MKNRTVEITVRRSYGKDRIYPVNDLGKALTALTGRAVFVKDDLPKIAALGFVVKQVADPMIAKLGEV